MKRIPLYYFLLCTLLLSFACNEDDDVTEDDSQFDVSLLYGEWKLVEARGIGDITGDLSGTFLFTGEESDATLRFPTGVLAGGAFRDGAVTGTMTYDPGNLNLPEGTRDWDNMLPTGAWTLTGDYLYFTDGIYGDFDGLIDELTEDTFILTGRRSNITLISNPGGNNAVLDGVYTFTFEK
jgi:hypothetical protein